LKIEAQSTVGEAAAQVIAVIRENIGEPFESILATLTRISQLNLDARTGNRTIEELNELAVDRYYVLFDSSVRIRRLRNTLERFERRIAEGAA
jgi:hypothetical protein